MTEFYKPPHKPITNAEFDHLAYDSDRATAKHLHVAAQALKAEGIDNSRQKTVENAAVSIQTASAERYLQHPHIQDAVHVAALEENDRRDARTIDVRYVDEPETLVPVQHGEIQPRQLQLA